MKSLGNCNCCGEIKNLVYHDSCKGLYIDVCFSCARDFFLEDLDTLLRKTKGCKECRNRFTPQKGWIDFCPFCREKYKSTMRIYNEKE